MKTASFLLCAAVACALGARPARAADSLPPSSFHAQAGPAFFVSTAGGESPWDVGYGLGAGLEAGVAPGTSVTFDLGYTHFGHGDPELLGRVDDNLTIDAGATDAEARLLTVLVGGKYRYRTRVPKLIVPYIALAGGLGHLSYRIGPSPADRVRTTSRAAAAGALGMEIRPRWLPLGVLVEAQYVQFFAEGARLATVPVRAGVTLGL